MNQRWTLHVQNFGKIRQADVQISPLIIFVGDNNSGKSYLMSLLWGLLAIGREMFSYKISSLSSYQKCDQWLLNNVGTDIDVNETVQEMFVFWFNDLLERNKKSLINRIFNYNIEIGKLAVKDYKRTFPLKVQWKKDAIRISSTKKTIKFPYIIGQPFTTEDRLRMLIYICWKLLMDEITAPLFPLMSKGKRSGEPVYLPASRTGFMLSYKSLVQDAIHRGFSPSTDDEGNNSVFTLPVNYFLQDIARFEKCDNCDKKLIANFIEDNLLMGKLHSDEMPVPNISFLPRDFGKKLPLYVTSSIVSEMAPIVLLLMSPLKFNSIIIEEPEAHLHPKLQLVIARAIIRLVNEGLPVWITTHSETILQHINNMIKLNNHPQKKDLMSRYKYEAKDLLSDKDVNMYQFDVLETQKTDIQKLHCGKYGFVVPTFNQTLYELSQETFYLQEGE